MIFDSLRNSALYLGLHPRLGRAFDYIASADLEALAPGRHEIEGDDLFVNVIECELKKPEEAKLEVHDAYIDVQVVVRGTESFGWSEREALRRPCGPFDAEKDIRFYDDAPQTCYTLVPGQFTIFMPGDAHAPMVGEGSVKKLIVKVRK
ncbi:YhcH/YjgK/YiaL family protein [uncultured Alistipes sp.]|uniref:YhcH/YjgK/YiaL family protein n=1 Tax=uncultured Alistipes sp. TaxID=538949 RepID=UPI0025CD464E|nr:YhcH/YjgK/YiaL family protein [uncultured Alistipes sp.]